VELNVLVEYDYIAMAKCLLLDMKLWQRTLQKEKISLL
jgi:hypothetical protein